jgi:hypothetical protein
VSSDSWVVVVLSCLFLSFWERQKCWRSELKADEYPFLQRKENHHPCPPIILKTPPSYDRRLVSLVAFRLPNKGHAILASWLELCLETEVAAFRLCFFQRCRFVTLAVAMIASPVASSGCREPETPRRSRVSQWRPCLVETWWARASRERRFVGLTPIGEWLMHILLLLPDLTS